MLYVTLRDDAPRAVLCCDQCHTAIDRLASAEAVFPTAFISGGRLARLLIVHREVCMDLALDTLREQAGASGSLSLREYLDELRDMDVDAV
jgi:hypothetical protein